MAVIPKRRPEEMFAELLEFGREDANVRDQIAALAREVDLVGSAVEAIADALGRILPAIQTGTGTPVSPSPFLVERIRAGRRGTIPQAPVANGPRSADTMQGAVGPMKSDKDKNNDG